MLHRLLPLIAVLRVRCPTSLRQQGRKRMASCSLTAGLAGSDHFLGRRIRSSQQLVSLRPVSSTAVICTAASTSDSVGSMNGSVANPFIRSHLRSLAAYTPIEPFEVLSKRLGRDPSNIVKLDANENPYGPPREVLDALGSMPFPNIYPDPETRRLRSALAELNNIPMANLLVREPCVYQLPVSSIQMMPSQQHVLLV